MEQKKYRLKKDLPDCKAGAIFEYELDTIYVHSTNGKHYLSYHKDIVENNPEWFEEVKEDTLKSIVNKYTPFSFYDVKNFTKMEQELERHVINREIELLRSIYPNQKDIRNKISELENKLKEIK